MAELDPIPSGTPNGDIAMETAGTKHIGYFLHLGFMGGLPVVRNMAHPGVNTDDYLYCARAFAAPVSVTSEAVDKLFEGAGNLEELIELRPEPRVVDLCSRFVDGWNGVGSRLADAKLRADAWGARHSKGQPKPLYGFYTSATGAFDTLPNAVRGERTRAVQPLVQPGG